MKLMNRTVLHILLSISCLVIPYTLPAQYSPPAGQPGTTAMHKDSSAFIDWASTCIIDRGFINIADTAATYNGFNKATFGSYLFGSGPADELVVSLGDHGTALLGFSSPVVNRPGPDFAVFENSFGDSFLELGFVEVSSDGQNFVRFPAVSLTPANQQVSTFDTIDATKVHNFAGKYRHGFGTPFDLDDIRDSLGIDLNNIILVRVTDAVGAVQGPYASTDSQGHKVNDPWPTPFDTGGFDLDAVGVVHNRTQGLGEGQKHSSFGLYPNPASGKVTFKANANTEVSLVITGSAGNVLIESAFTKMTVLDLSTVCAGMYFATCSFPDGSSITKKIIKY